MSQQWGGGYGPYGPYGAYGPPPDPGIRNGAVAALIANCCAVVLCCGVPSIGGLICAAIAMSKADYQPDLARKLNMWAWILFGGTFLLDIIFVICMYVFPVLMIGLFGATAT